MSRSLNIAVLIATAALAGCASERASGPGPGDPPPRTAPAGVSMPGRWMLSSGSGGMCGMNFAGGGGEGTIAPEGGCPGNFFTSRKWVFEGNALVIRNHTGEPLAQLSMVSVTRFQGRGNSGEQITLSR